ncbi:MAG TPA: hemolysin family protein [Pyrinomonadaceae bacterium]|nr:hemolysin family protein [Pyrinomonadaceae bacterium]
MGLVIFEISVVVILIIANGVFAMSEMSVVSARRSRLQQLANEGNAAAQAALELSSHPDKFLSTIQIGITLIGILAGAFGGATLASKIGDSLQTVPTLAPYAQAIGFSIVVISITYLTLIIGELVPKRIALNNPEKIASLIARPMTLLSRFAAPVVSVLSLSTNTIFRLLGIKSPGDAPISEEELKLLIEQGTQAGVFHETEQAIVERVFRLGDRRVTALMTPRPDMVFLNADASEEHTLQVIAGSKFSRFPVYRGNTDNILGVVKVKEYLASKLIEPETKLEDALTKPLFIPETSTAFHLLGLFKDRGLHLALVIDEFGSVNGMVTSNDFLEALSGEAESLDPEDVDFIERKDGTVLVDGAVPIDELYHRFPALRRTTPGGNYHTVAGLFLHRLGQIPTEGDEIKIGNYKLEVVDMDGRRIDKILIRPAGIDSK